MTGKIIMTAHLASEYSIEEIKSYWKSQAEKYASSHKASWQDIYMIEKEIEAISSFLGDGFKVLDIGCGNGYSTIRYAKDYNLCVKGVDYVEELINAAKDNLKNFPFSVKSKVEFKVANILELFEPENYYDRIITARVFINLNNRENQEKAVHNIRKLIKPNGKALLAEATLGGRERLNALRAECGLSEIPVPSFNFYIDEDWFVKTAKRYFSKVTVLNHASTYYVGSRVVQPLMLKLKGADTAPDPLSEINRLFSALPSYGDYGIQKLFILEP